MEKENKKRILYIDALRGFAILLVVYSHIVNLTTGSKLFISSFNEFCLSFRMPLFFFISGFFIYSKNYNIDLIKKRCYNRIVKQFYPTLLLLSVLVIFFFNSDFSFLFTEIWKKGYWFTITVVELFFIALPILYFVSNKIFGKKHPLLCIFTYAIIAKLIIWLISKNVSLPVNCLFGLTAISKYLPYFFAGILLRANYDKFLKIITNKIVATISFVIFIVAFILWDNELSYIFTAFSAIIFIHALAFYLFKNDKVVEHKISQGLIYLGTMTLEIYLLHYFFLIPLGKYEIGGYLNAIANTTFEIPTILILSVLVSVVCLLVVRFLKLIRINNFIFPNQKKK